MDYGSDEMQVEDVIFRLELGTFSFLGEYSKTRDGKEIEQKLEKNPRLERGLMDKLSDRGYSLPRTELIDDPKYRVRIRELKELIRATENEIQQDAEEEERKEQEIFNRAKETGEKQLLKSSSKECTDPTKACDIDNVNVYANPDGNITEEIMHNF